MVPKFARQFSTVPFIERHCHGAILNSRNAFASFSTLSRQSRITAGIEAYLDQVASRQYDMVTQLTEASSKRHQPLSALEMTRLSKRISASDHLVGMWKEHKRLAQTIASLEEILSADNPDPVMTEMARDEAQGIFAEIDTVESQIVKHLLVPPKSEISQSAIMEVRAGTGGVEATLFAAEMLAMYKRFADRNLWDFHLISVSSSAASESDGHSLISSITGGSQGIRDATVCIKGRDGENIYDVLKYESGVHRVQRIPKTDTQGRIHTSTMTVAILPLTKDVSIDVNDRDLRIDSFRSSGPGGQSVNKSNSAVRIVHIPTGITVAMQEERSAEMNRSRALKVLHARLLQAKIAEGDAERRSNRQAQIGQAERSDKIRTYNFPQDRITDHRVNFSTFGIETFFSGTALQAFIDRLKADDDARRLAEFASKRTSSLGDSIEDEDEEAGQR